MLDIQLSSGDSWLEWMLTIIKHDAAIKMTQSDQDKIEKRKKQLRESQRKRRELLSENGERHQVNIFLSNKAKKILDASCLANTLDRHQLVERLILELNKTK